MTVMALVKTSLLFGIISPNLFSHWRKWQTARIQCFHPGSSHDESIVGSRKIAVHSFGSPDFSFASMNWQRSSAIPLSARLLGENKVQHATKDAATFIEPVVERTMWSSDNRWNLKNALPKGTIGHLCLKLWNMNFRWPPWKFGTKKNRSDGQTGPRNCIDCTELMGPHLSIR
jgi:hypothetical protein